MRNRRLLIGAILATPLLVGGCAESATRDGQVFRCRLLLENPNAEDLEVVGGNVTLELAGESAASARPMEKFILPANGSKEVDMRVTMDLLSSLSSVLKLAAAGGTELDYTLKGYVDLDVKALGRLPFRSNGKVALDKLLRQVPGLVRPVPAGPA